MTLAHDLIHLLRDPVAHDLTEHGALRLSTALALCVTRLEPEVTKRGWTLLPPELRPGQRTCERCAKKYSRHPTEAWIHYARRKYCSLACVHGPRSPVVAPPPGERVGSPFCRWGHERHYSGGMMRCRVCDQRRKALSRNAGTLPGAM